MSNENDAPETPADVPGDDSADTTGSRGKKIGIAAAAVVAVAAIVTVAAVTINNDNDNDADAETAGGDTTDATDTGDAGSDAADAEAAGGHEHGTNAVHQDEVLVTTDWLEENLDNPDVVVIEVSENRPDSGLTPYEEGHIPGAVELVWTEDFVQDVTRDVVSQEEFTELGQAAGIGNDSTVVLYGDANNWFAAWGSWVFKYYGTEDVRLLDGGRVKWEAEGRPLDNVPPTPEPGDYQAQEPNEDIRAYQPEVLEIANAESPEAAEKGLVDIRGPQEYNGEIAVAEGFDGEAAVKLGHIPNAVNVPWATIVNEDGSYLSPEEIRDVYAEVGIDGSKPIVVYCRIGERASHTWYALSQILGYDVKLYDGSWTEWGNSVAVPIQNNTTGERSGLWS